MAPQLDATKMYANLFALPPLMQWQKVNEATLIVGRNMHARRDYVKASEVNEEAFHLAASLQGYEADGFSLRRKSDGSCPDDDDEVFVESAEVRDGKVWYNG